MVDLCCRGEGKVKFGREIKVKVEVLFGRSAVLALVGAPVSEG